MNEPHLASDPGIHFIVQALDGLNRTTGIIGRLTSVPNSADAAVTLQVAGKSLTYTCEVKTKIDRYHTLNDLKARSLESQSALLVCQPLTNALAARCRELDIQFIDTAGNAYFTDRQGVLINVTGSKAEHAMAAPVPDLTITSSALRMMFAFLADPSMLNAPYRTISTSVNISTGVIGKVLATLETRGFIGTTPGGKRIITDPERMLSEWATGYVGRLRPKLNKYRFTTTDPGHLHTWNPGYRESAWSGEVAAEMITEHLHPATFTIYLDMENQPHVLSELVKSYKLRADPHGTVEVVQAFWNRDCFTDAFPTVPLHLVYADLLGTHESRNLLVAKQIFNKVIDHVHHSTR